MKKFILIICLLPSLAFSQSDFAEEFYLNINIGPQWTQSKDAFLIGNGTQAYSNYTSYDGASSSILQLELSVEYIGKYVYVYSDPGISWATNYLLNIAPRQLLSDKPFRFEKNEINAFEFEPLRFNIGGWITDEIGVFAGAQYNFTTIMANPEFVKSRREEESPNIVRSVNGGNARGFGVHAFYELDQFLFQYSFMRNWVANSSRENLGKGIRQEARVRYGSNSFGGLVCLEHNVIRMEAVNHLESYDVSSYADYSVLLGNVPETTASTFAVRFGIYFSF